MFFVRFSLTDNWVGWFQGINVAFRWMENNFSWTALRGMKSCCANEKPDWQSIRHFSNLIEFFIVRSFSGLIIINSITFYHLNNDNYRVFIRNGSTINVISCVSSIFSNFRGSRASSFETPLKLDYY